MEGIASHTHAVRVPLSSNKGNNVRFLSLLGFTGNQLTHLLTLHCAAGIVCVPLPRRAPFRKASHDIYHPTKKKKKNS